MQIPYLAGIGASTDRFDLIDGLPVHALVIHLVVVLLPLCAIGAILCALIPRFSTRFGLLVWLGSAVGLGSAFLAERSGEALARRVGMPVKHEHYGEYVKYYAAALLAVTFIMWLMDRQSGGRRQLSGKILAGLVIVVAGGTLYGVYMAGHSGAVAVWQSVVS